MTLHYINFFYLFFIFMTQGVIVIVFNYNIKDEIERSYFRYMSRMSFLPTRFTIFEEKVTTFDKSTLQNQEEKNSNFNFRPLNNNEIEKLKFYQNYVIVFPVKLYSKIEQRFVELNFCLLIQWGDENSLLKRGVYFSVTRNINPNFVIHSAFLSDTSVNCTHYFDKYDVFFNISVAYDLMNTIHKQKENNEKLKDINTFEEFMIELDKNRNFSYFKNSPKGVKEAFIKTIFNVFDDIIREYLSLFIEPGKYDIDKKEL